MQATIQEQGDFLVIKIPKKEIQHAQRARPCHATGQEIFGKFPLKKDTAKLLKEVDEELWG